MAQNSYDIIIRAKDAGASGVIGAVRGGLLGVARAGALAGGGVAHLTRGLLSVARLVAPLTGIAGVIGAWRLALSDLSRSADVSAQIAKTGAAWETLRAHIMAPIEEPFTGLLATIGAMLPSLHETALSVGNSIGRNIALFSESLKQGRLGEVVLKTVGLALVQSVGVWLTEMLENAQYIGKFVLSAVGGAFLTVVDYFRSGMLKVLDTVAAALNKLPGVNISSSTIASEDTRARIAQRLEGGAGSVFASNLTAAAAAAGWSRDMAQGPNRALSRALNQWADSHKGNMETSLGVKWQTRTAEDVANFRRKTGKGESASPPKSQTQTPQKSEGRMSDSYARIGLFVGGTGAPPSLDYARRSAQAGDTQVKLLRELVSAIKDTSSRDAKGGVLWA